MPERYLTWITTVETMQGTFVSMFGLALAVVASWYLRCYLPRSWRVYLDDLYIIGGMVAWVYTLVFSLWMGA